jgi:hypothetical protein
VATGSLTKRKKGEIKPRRGFNPLMELGALQHIAIIPIGLVTDCVNGELSWQIHNFLSLSAFSYVLFNGKL